MATSCSMPSCLVALSLFLSITGAPSLRARPDVEVDREWWLRPQRLVQTNLREIDATMDLDRYMADIRRVAANVVLFNVGGIVANYPTDLPYHYRNPHMKGDLVGEIVQRLHDERIRIIGRFDFSKLNEKLAADKAEWLYVSEKGQNVNYNGQVHTCLNGGYQQDYMLEILEEALSRYPLDGVFFNMIGYQRRDYSGNYHGICQCRNCHRRFRDFCGEELPATQREGDPVYQKYLEFCRETASEQFHRVNDRLARRWPEVAICTYTTAGVDVIRKESNSRRGRGAYYDSEKAEATLLHAGRRQLANAAVHFIDIPYRHAAVSPYLTVRRLWQHMTHGAWLDFYAIGPIHRQGDRTGLDLLAELYRFHASNEKWLTTTEAAADVELVHRSGEEYRGLYQILAENHVAFRLVSLESLQPGEAAAILLPDGGGLGREACARLDACVENGRKLLVTAGLEDALACFGEARLRETYPRRPGAYIRIRPEDRERLGGGILEQIDLVFLERPLGIHELDSDTEGLLRLIPSDQFGPPEKCYYRKVSGHPALLFRRFGDGAAACFPWAVGSLYGEQCHQGHAALVLGALDSLLGVERRLRVDAPPLVEVTHRRGDGFEWIALFNHSGQLDRALHAPLPVDGIRVDLQPLRPVRSARLLEKGTPVELERNGDDRVRARVDGLSHYDVLLFEYE